MTFTPLAPDPDGFTRAVQTARRRRLRTMGVTTGAAGVTAFLLATLVTGGGVSSLSQDDPVAHDPSPTTSAVALPSLDPARPNAVSGGTGAGTTGAPVPSSSQVRVPGATGPGSAPRPTSGPAVAARYTAGPMASQQNALLVPNCLGGPGTCGVSDYDPNSAQLDAFLCSSSTDPYTLHYPDAREVDLTVLSGKTVVWQWSAFHPAAGAAHTQRLDSGRCTHWWVSWHAVDNAGRPLPRGDYVVRATFLAREVTPPTTDSTFTIS